jgi:hypothetical protein
MLERNVKLFRPNCKRQFLEMHFASFCENGSGAGHGAIRCSVAKDDRTHTGTFWLDMYL